MRRALIVGGAIIRAGVAILFVVALGACSGSPTEEVFVSAAASLTDAFGQMEAAFEAAHPGVDVILNFAGSSALREQILEGAPADVFASANASNMERVEAEGLTAGPARVFATNRLAIAVPAGNPGRVSGLQDFGRAELLLGLCAEQVPCGELARTALSRAGVTPAVDTEEPDVRALLTKIEAGELDAGITYLTDVVSAGAAVEAIRIPDSASPVADYPIAVLTGGRSQQMAAEFVDFVMSEEGRRILMSYGFGTP
jgi:molybdate transport system substrate-binding protein